jgi:hypothetical protein
MTMPFGSGFSPLQGEPRSGLVPIPLRTPTYATLTTGGGVRTATAAEVLGGLFVINCDDAQTLTLPTAALLNRAIPAVCAGASFEFDVINTGDSVLTVAVGTGGTLAVGSNSKNTVATLVALVSKRFIVYVTGVVQNGDAADGYILFGLGSTAAAVA